MFIKTGLEPTVKRHKVNKMMHHIAFGHISGSYPVPLESLDIGEVYVVEFRTVEDTQEFPKGTVQEVMILSKEPSVVKKGVLFRISGTDVSSERETIEYVRFQREHGFPNDAKQDTHWVGNFHVKETVISWYELGV